MSEEIKQAVAAIQQAFEAGDHTHLREATDTLYRLTRTTADWEARAAYEEHSAEHTCGYWLDG